MTVRAPGVDPDLLRRVRQIEVKARVLANDQVLGRYRSVFRGQGLEFEEVREYEPGDEIRSIDWNVTARMGTPYVKRYREERELTLVLAVDVSSSAWFGTRGTSKQELATELAALMALAAQRSNDRVALLLFADEVVEWVPPGKGRNHMLRVVRQLLATAPRRRRTDVARAARYLASVQRRRAIVLIVSDFLDEGFEQPMRVLGREHDVIAVVLNDPREQELPNVGMIALEDAETGRVEYVDTGSRKVREQYAATAQRRRVERARAFARMSLDQVDLWTDRPWLPALLALFQRRARQGLRR